MAKVMDANIIQTCEAPDNEGTKMRRVFATSFGSWRPTLRVCEHGRQTTSFCSVFVCLEATIRVRLEVDRPPVLDQPVIEIDAVDIALADTPNRRCGSRLKSASGITAC
jgi:hypothetical protein